MFNIISLSELVNSLKSIDNGYLILNDLEEETNQRICLIRCKRKTANLLSKSGQDNYDLSWTAMNEGNGYYNYPCFRSRSNHQ